LTFSGRYRFCSSFCSLGHLRGHATAYEFGEKPMEYAIAGLVSLGLGIYLLYALLRPEKF
jgi:K+-transporting ATPase KdpF subunit